MAMFSVDDVFQSDIGFGLGHKTEVVGWLVVSPHLSYLASSESQQRNAILVIAPGLYEQFVEQLPVRCGTMVGFTGNARISGKISKSGLHPLPYAFYKVEKITFQEADGSSAIYVPTNDEDPDWFYSNETPNK